MPRMKGKDYSGVLTEDNLKQWYFRDKLSQVDIAKKLGCSKHLVSWYMRKFDLKVRDHPVCVILGMMRSPIRRRQTIREVGIC